MFKHICTTAPINLTESDNLDLKREPIIMDILSSWKNHENTNKELLDVRLFHLSHILSWNVFEDRFYFENLRYLIELGRQTNQLVILQIENQNQLKQLRDKRLFEIINFNMELVNLEEENANY